MSRPLLMRDVELCDEMMGILSELRKIGPTSIRIDPDMPEALEIRVCTDDNTYYLADVDNSWNWQITVCRDGKDVADLIMHIEKEGQ